MINEIEVLSADYREQVHGVTSLGEYLFVIHTGDRCSDQIDVYFNSDFTFLHHISVPGLNEYSVEDFTSCDTGATAFLLIVDVWNQCLHKITRDENNWRTVERHLPDMYVPCATSAVVSSGNRARVIVACTAENALRLSSGKLIELNDNCESIIREVDLHSRIIREPEGEKVSPLRIRSLSCVRELKSGDFVVSYSRSFWCARRKTIAIVDRNGKITQSYGDWWFPGDRVLLKGKCHVAVDSDGFVFVPDSDKHRILLLNPTLQFVRFIPTKNRPRWLHFDKTYRRLLVGHESNIATVLKLPPRPYSY